MSVLYSPVLKYSDVELRRNQEMMDSSIGHPQQHCHQHNSGLMRYCSAPSSLLASLIDNNINNNNNTHGCVNEEAFTSEDHHPYLPSTTSSEMDTMLSKSIPSNNGWSNSEPLQQEFGGKHVKQEAGGESVPQGPQLQNSYSYVGSELIYQQGLPNGSNSSGATGNAFYGSFVVNPVASESSAQSKMGVRNCSNLVRQKSSPAGFFSNENGLAILREVGSFKGSDVVSNGQAIAAPTRGLHGTLNFSSRPSSCLKRMPLIAESGNESLEANCDQSSNLVNDNGSSKCHMPSFTSEFWDNSAFSAQKSESEDEIMFSTTNGLESQEADFCYQNLGLTHHLSLPSSSTKMASIDQKYLQIQGSVPCKIRAKRGFATHPRSIAERVRRTRISERIKKLQGLFPKSDKQTRISFNETFQERQLGVTWDVDLYGELLKIGGGKERMTAYFNKTGWPANAPASEQERKEFVASLHKRKTELFMALIEKKLLPLRPGVAKLIDQALSQGVNVAVCSTSNEKAVSAIVSCLLGPKRAEKIQIFAGDVVPRKKPDPAIYLLAASTLGVEPSRCVVVEDSAIGLAAAKSAGMKCIVTKSGYTADEDFLNADAVFDFIGDPPEERFDLAFCGSLLEKQYVSS